MPRIKSDAVVLLPVSVLTSMLILEPLTLRIGQLAGLPGMLDNLADCVKTSSKPLPC